MDYDMFAEARLGTSRPAVTLRTPLPLSIPFQSTLRSQSTPISGHPLGRAKTELEDSSPHMNFRQTAAKKGACTPAHRRCSVESRSGMISENAPLPPHPRALLRARLPWDSRLRDQSKMCVRDTGAFTRPRGYVCCKIGSLV